MNPVPADPAFPVDTGRIPVLTRGLRWLIVGAITLYQRTLSPVLPVLTLGTCGCRFSPTCSHYAAEAIRTHGVFAGGRLAVIRLLKCTPLHRGGSDPVPPPGGRRPGPSLTCRAVRSA